MAEEHIIIVDDNKALCNTIVNQIEEKHGNKYTIAKFYDAKDAMDYIREDIDEEGDRLAMVGSDERLEGIQGHEFLSELKKTHPKTKKFIFSAWSDVEALVSGINTKIDGFVSKKTKEDAGDPLFELIDKLLDEYESEPKLSYNVGEIAFKQVDTLYDKLNLFKKRYEIYLQAGHKTEDTLRTEELESQMEWDEYDVGGIEEMILTLKVRYLTAKKNNDCVGGVRIIEGECPLETGICITDGTEQGLKKEYKIDENFNLNCFREEGINTREISRLIIDPNSRKSGSVVLIGLFKIIEQLTCDQNTLFCTSKEEQLKLYQAVGFETIGPKINYSLTGDWIPMKRNRWKAINQPDSIEGMSQKFHLRAIEPIPVTDVNKWNEYSRTINEEAIKKGLYVDGQG